MFKKIKYLIPSLITLTIILVIYYINKLYPFTSNSIVQVDADYQYIPVLYRIYDFIHFKSNILYSDIGLGNSIYTSMIIQGSIFSPLTILLYFTKRSNIVNYFNILVMIKMALISLTAYIYFKKKYVLNEFYLILFSIIYTFSGWVILNYFNIMWLDCVILFPIIMLYLDKLINEDKYYGYVITLAMSLAINYYISLFILIFIFIYSFLNIFILKKKANRKKTIFLLGTSTVNAILISSFSLIPALYHTFNSSRLSLGGSYPLFKHTINKIIYLMGMSLPLILIVLLNIKNINNYREMFVIRLLLFLYTINIVFEPINLAMHFGSYWSFPFRYAFITLFIFVNISLYYFTKYPITYSRKVKIIPLILTIILSVFVIYFSNKYYYTIKYSQITLDFNKWEVFKYILIILLMFIAMKIFTLLIKNKILVKIFIVITTLVEIFITTSWCMYYSSGYYLAREANEANNAIKFDNDHFKRYKIDYPYYSIDYGLLMNVNTLDNWLHILPKGMTNNYKKIGYLINDSSIKALGGTIFTDNLLNMNYIISKNNLEDNMYTPLQTDNSYKLYKYNTQLPYGIIYNSNNIINNNEEYGFYLQNLIYKSLFDKEDQLIDIKTFYNSTTCLNISDSLKEDSYIYLDLSHNGKNINYIKIKDNYISNLDNYIKYLGIYNNEIDIEVCPKDNNTIDYIDLGIINVSKYHSLVNNTKNEIKVSYDKGYLVNTYIEEDNKSLFLPINNIKGLDIRKNNNKIIVDSYLDNFISIKLSKGENNITIKYHEPYLLLSILLSILGLLILVMFKYININNKYLLNVSYYVFIIMGFFIYFYFYVYSFIKK